MRQEALRPNRIATRIAPGGSFQIDVAKKAGNGFHPASSVLLLQPIM
jgi:hypothetical protein